jgi:hypothetical protein
MTTTRRVSFPLFALVLLAALLLAGCRGFDRLNPSPTAAPPTELPVAVVTVAPAPVLPTATLPPTDEPAPPAEPEPAPEADEPRGVFVEGLQVNIVETVPVQVRAEVIGNLPDGCTTLSGTRAERDGATFTIVFDLARDPLALCTQVLVPFKETVPLDVEQLAAGTYTVVAGEQEAAFTLVADNVAPPEVDLSGATLVPASDMVKPGETVTLSGSGFPAGDEVELGLGQLNSEYELVETVTASASGAFRASLPLPEGAAPGQIWVFVAAVGTETVLTDGVTVVPGPPQVTAVPPDAGVNVPVNGQFTRTYVYLIAVEDNGASGPAIGCGDGVIPVIAEIEPTVAPMGAAYRHLLALEDEYFGESGLYNALYRSDLELVSIGINNGQATVKLSGELVLGGVCDAPRVQAQLAETALQYRTVRSVQILVNGTPLEELLSGE